MCILDINYFKKQSINYIIVSVLCLAFGLIYEIFSHGVYSLYMICAFLIPLIFGFGVSICIYKLKLNRVVDRISINLYNASIATFTTYSIVNGVLEIYGTTNVLVNVYTLIGTILGLLSIVGIIGSAYREYAI